MAVAVIVIGASAWPCRWLDWSWPAGSARAPEQGELTGCAVLRGGIAIAAGAI
jgi:hypothetical protein